VTANCQLLHGDLRPVAVFMAEYRTSFKGSRCQTI
jgi:hypothetical protein